MRGLGKGPRAQAMVVLGQFEKSNQNVAELIDRYLHGPDHRAQAVDIIYGVIRNRKAIDNLIALVSGRALNRINRRVRNILRIGVYELVYCSAQAAYAIVNEAVNLAKAAGSQKSSGFVNAILRKTADSIVNKQALLKDADRQKTLPVRPGLGCEFSFNVVFSDEGAQAEYLSEVFSLPVWLTQAWVEDFGFARSVVICFGSNRRPSIYIRANGLKISTEELYEKFAAGGVDSHLLKESQMIRLKGAGNISQLPGFSEGEFTVQDITASKAVRLLSPRQGARVLDLCAAPGTKTSQIAEMMGDRGTVIATDIDSERLKKVEQNCQRLRLSSVKTAAYDEIEEIAKRDGLFDAILIDAPCSNSGVMARRCEVRYRINPDKLTEIVETQQSLLRKAVSLVRRGGQICYSTCSICTVENSEVVQSLLAEKQDFQLVKELLTFPSAETNDCDGGYAAVLLKI